MRLALIEHSGQVALLIFGVESLKLIVPPPFHCRYFHTLCAMHSTIRDMSTKRRKKERHLLFALEVL